MLKQILLNQVIPQILYFFLIVIAGVVVYYIKKFYNDHKSLIEYQKQQLIQKIGIDKYNHEIDVAKGLILSVESMGKDFNWEGTVKHAKATELISKKTGLTDDEIYNVIKATIALWNKDRNKTTNTAAAETTTK